METVKKYWFWGIFISILSIFAMSHNANAVDLTFNLNNYEINRAVPSTQLNCSFTNGINSVSSGSTYCLTTISGTTSISKIETNNTYSFKAGDLATFYLFIQTQTTGLSYTPVLNAFSSSSHGWQLLNYKEVTREEFDKAQNSSNSYFNFSSGGSTPLNIDYYFTNGYTRIYEFIMRATSDGTYSLGLYSTAPLYIFNSNDVGNQVWFSLRNFVVYRFVGSEENKEVEEKTQEAVDESQTAGGDSSTSAQTGTTGLLNAITGAVSVISSAQPTNCKINGNMGNLDIGQLDLCANPAPAFVQTIGSLILILMCVPLAISLFNRFIAIFRSFQS